MDENYSAKEEEHLVIISLTDDGLYGNPYTCNLNDEDIYSNDDYCVHTKDSCHYHKEDKELQSLAADLKINGFNENKIKEALNNCLNEKNVNTYFYKNKGTHIHISINCANDKGG